MTWLYTHWYLLVFTALCCLAIGISINQNRYNRRPFSAWLENATRGLVELLPFLATLVIVALLMIALLAVERLLYAMWA